SIGEMLEATAKIGQGRFDVKSRVRRRDELGELSDSMNRMAAQLDSLVRGQKRFLADAAHELRSPLGRMQLALELLERERGDAGQAGPIVIRADAANGDVRITFADSGPGVPEEALEKLFTPFYRTEESRNRLTGGAGLGLAIVKSCAEACQGTVECRNRRPS